MVFDGQMPPTVDSSLRQRLSVTLDLIRAPMALEVMECLHHERPLSALADAGDAGVVDAAVSQLGGSGLVTDQRPDGESPVLTATGERFWTAIETIGRSTQR